MTKKIKEIKIEYENFQKIHPLQWPEATLVKISNMRGISLSDVKNIMANNVITFKQLALITGIPEVSLRGKMVPKYRRRTQTVSAALTTCHPFPADERGPMFILVDDLCVQLINDSLEK